MAKKLELMTGGYERSTDAAGARVVIPDALVRGDSYCLVDRGEKLFVYPLDVYQRRAKEYLKRTPENKQRIDFFSNVYMGLKINRYNRLPLPREVANRILKKGKKNRVRVIGNGDCFVIEPIKL